jgi:curved DNA-binding protein CbpA
MAKDFYEILGVNKNAPLEEIKKNYRKLAQKWHPDKWTSKSVEERQRANEKMQKLNRAYEILGDEDKRKRYDLGETNFTYDTSENFDWDSYYKTEREKLNTEAEKIRFQLEAVARRDVINTIGFELDITEILTRQLDSKLWEPYSRWGEKVLELEVLFTEDGRLDKINSPLYKFQAEIISAIRKRKEELKKGINNPQVNKARIHAVESIERELQNRKLESTDLGVEYSDYQEKINSLPKVWEINAYRDKVKEYIRRNLEKNNNREEFANLKHNFYTSPENNEEWNKEKESLLTEVEELKKTATKENQEKLTKKINSLEELAKQLLREIQELKIEIQESKKEGDSSLEASVFINQKENELQVKQSRLQQLESIITHNNNNNNNPSFPIIPIVSTVGVAFLLGIVVYIWRRNLKRGKRK